MLLVICLLGTYVAADTDVTITATPNYTGVPLVTASNATNITSTTALLHGNITHTGSENATVRGFEWGYSTGNYSSSWNETGNYSIGGFDRAIASLTPEVQVFWRAFAVNSYGQGNSTEQSFVTGSGLPLAPTNFTITQVGAGSINITWVMGVGATLIVIRGNEGNYPTDITDGYLVYSGNGTYVEIDSLSLGSTTYCYRAWCWNPYGYSLDYAEASIGGSAMLAVFLGVIALGVTGLSFWKRFILLTIGASLSWVVLGILLLIGPELLGLPTISESWVQVLAYLFFAMAAGCILWFISGIGKVKFTKTDSKAGLSWSGYGRPPTEQKPSRSSTVKSSYRDRLRKVIK